MGGGAGAGEGGGEAAAMVVVVVVVVEKILEGESEAFYGKSLEMREREITARPLHCYSAETSQVFGVAIGIFTGIFCFVISTDSVVIFLAFFSF